MANPTPIAIPVPNKPGQVYIPALGKSFAQIELREDDVFDTVSTGSGAIAAGKELKFFSDLSNKLEQHTNMPNPSRIASGDEVAVFRIGLHPREATGQTLPVFDDYRKVFGNAHLIVEFNRRLITTGPAVKYSSGYGLAGVSDESSATAVSVGVPSQAAAPTLFVPQTLADNDDTKGRLRFPDASWITGYVVPTLSSGILVTLFLHGVMKNPLGK